MRFSLRTLILVMLLGGPALAAIWWWWPALLVFAGSALLTLCVLVGTLWIHQWQIHRVKSRLAQGKHSAGAVGMELSVILCFVVASAGIVGCWVEYIVPRIAK